MQQKWHCCGCRKQADLVCCRKDELHTRLSPQWRGGVDPELALGHLSDHSWHIWAWEAEAGYDPSCCSMKQLVLWLCPGSPQSRHMLEIPSQPWSPLPGNETWDIESQQAFLSPSQVLAVLSWAVFTDFIMGSFVRETQRRDNVTKGVFGFKRGKIPNGEPECPGACRSGERDVDTARSRGSAVLPPFAIAPHFAFPWRTAESYSFVWGMLLMKSRGNREFLSTHFLVCVGCLTG